MRNPLSETIVNIKPSGIRKFFDLVSEMNDKDVISLGVGEPDFDTPWHVRDEGIYSLEKGRTFYTSNSGLKELREEICNYLDRRYQVSYDWHHETIVTVGGSEGIDIAMRAMLDPGDEVLIPQPSYVSYEPCAILAGGKPVIIELKAENEFRLTPEELLEYITDKTKIVAMTQVSNVLGRENPIRAVADLAHAKGAVMVVDGAQSTPHKAVDVQALGADFLAFSGHKIFGPMGIGALYGRKELLKKMPPFLSGGEMIESVTREGAVFAELPHKFEAGTVNAAGAVGLHAAINYLQKIGYEEMERRETALVARALAGMKEMPYVHVLGSELPEEHTGIVAFAVDGVHPHDISEILAADDIAVRAGHHCAQPLLKHLGYNSTVRASFAFYNTEEEVDRLLASVSTLRERMGYGK